MLDFKPGEEQATLGFSEENEEYQILELGHNVCLNQQ